MAGTTTDTSAFQAMLETTRGLARDFAETYERRDQAGDFPHDEMAKLKKSGLLKATVPKEFGGLGLSYAQFIELVFILAAANPSIAHNYIEHGVFAREILLGTPNAELRQRILGSIVGKNAFITNAGAERNSPTVLNLQSTFVDDPARKGVLFNGKKFFSTGAACSDFLFTYGRYRDGFAFTWIPTNAPGVTVMDDWDAIGMRGTGSGSTEYKDVFIPIEHIVPIGKLDEKAPDPNSLFSPLFQNAFAAIYIGAAEGALAHAIGYLKSKSRPYGAAGVATAAEDPYVLLDIGRMQSHLWAARALVREAAEATDRGLEARGKVDIKEMTRLRLEAMVTVAAAKVAATDAALETCTDAFKICGARVALSGQGLDKFLRDIRTLTLHDPVDYKARIVGEYAVTGDFYTYLPFYT